MLKGLLAFVLCAVLFVCIWFATVWNNFAFHNALIADDYLMPVALFSLLVVVLAVNPLLRRFVPRLSFSRRGLAVICGVLFMAALPPSAGILRQLAFPLADAVERANTEQSTANAYHDLSPRPALFPDSLVYQDELPVIGPFIDQLSPGESIPWHAWVAPIASWSAFIIPWYFMMVALAAILSRYWQEEERAPYPLLAIFRYIIDVPDHPSHATPPIFRRRRFWIACLLVFFLHALLQARHYAQGGIPAIPLSWNLSPYFREVPWRYIAWWLKGGRLFFSFVAVAYFLSNRTSFSIWFCHVFVGCYLMIGRAYFVPFDGSVVGDARVGAIVTFSISVLWLARRHLMRVGRCMIRPVDSPRDRAYRIAGWCFVAGCAGMFIWFCWVRVPPIYAIIFVFAAILTTITLMRVVAETGLPLFMFDTALFISFLRMIPLSLRTLSTMYFGGLLSVWLGSGQRVCVGAVATQAMCLDKKNDVPRHL